MRVKRCVLLLILALLAINIFLVVVYVCRKKQVPPAGYVTAPTKILPTDVRHTDVRPRDLRHTDVRPTDVADLVEESVTLFMRMTGLHIRRFYCDFLRTIVLFWPASYGKLVLVFDEESSDDHRLAKIIEGHFDQFFPDRKLEILYESYPSGYETLLTRPWPRRGVGFNRQIWSSFYNDLYTNDTVIAWVDSDSAISAAVTRNSMYNGTRLRVIGSDCTLLTSEVARRCLKNAAKAIGLPSVGDFMLHFPVYIYRDTFANCRKYLIRKYKARNFEEVYRIISGYGWMCSVTTVLNYAWHFERDRYDWNLKICTAPLDEYNKRFRPKSTVRPHDIPAVLAVPQSSVRTGRPDSARDTAQLIVASYCLSHKAAGHNLTFCTDKRDFPLSNNFVLLKFVKMPVPCDGDLRNTCLNVMQRHYNLVGSEILEKKRRMEWSDVELVEKLEKEVHHRWCPPIRNGGPGGRNP